MNKFDFEYDVAAHNQVLKFDAAQMESILEISKGEPTMSDKETKFAIVVMKGMLTTQHALIESLVKEVETLKNKKSFIQKLFKK